uniref:Transmembrane protein 221 n=1 Tax=Pogona vitticeps TaxID=103695 RepID=A0ABM5ELK1_9SAUR
MAALSAYGTRTIGTLILFGTVAGLMAVLASTLIFQIQAGSRAGPGRAGGLPESARRILRPLSAGLAALCLVLSLSCLVLSLLHAYCGAGRGAPPGGAAGPDRGDWFLLDSRQVRHVAVGLFCCGVSAYLSALSMYMLVLFEIETGISGACILSSGIVVLVLTVTHALIRSSRTAPGSRGEFSHTLYENDSASEAPTTHLNNTKTVVGPRARPEIHREFSYPSGVEAKSCLTTPGSSNLASSGSGEPASEKESYGVSRMHCTLSAESALLQVHGKPWDGVTREMKNVLSRKPVGSGKDSTLV